MPTTTTTVDAESGVEAVFTKDSGVSPVDAVGASCAVPLVWPPVTIVVTPDAVAKVVIGGNVLDPAQRSAAVRGGPRGQGAGNIDRRAGG